MHAATPTSSTSFGPQSTTARARPDIAIRAKLAAIREGEKRLEQEKRDAIALAELTHAYRPEAAQILDVRENDLSVLLRTGLLANPIHGYHNAQMFDRQVLQALIDFRASLQPVG